MGGMERSDGNHEKQARKVNKEMKCRVGPPVIKYPTRKRPTMFQEKVKGAARQRRCIPPINAR
jgi:hypothetical protein